MIDRRAVKLLASFVYLVRMYSRQETGKFASSESDRPNKNMISERAAGLELEYNHTRGLLRSTFEIDSFKGQFILPLSRALKL